MIALNVIEIIVLIILEKIKDNNNKLMYDYIVNIHLLLAHSNRINNNKERNEHLKSKFNNDFNNDNNNNNNNKQQIDDEYAYDFDFGKVFKDNPMHSNLKEELLNQNICKLSLESYYDFVEKAIHLLNTKMLNNIKLIIQHIILKNMILLMVVV